jgi:hypothetical protein
MDEALVVFEAELRQYPKERGIEGRLLAYGVSNSLQIGFARGISAAESRRFYAFLSTGRPLPGTRAYVRRL